LHNDIRLIPTSEKNAVEKISKFYGELLDFFVNPKDQSKNAAPIYAGFLDGNIFEHLCKKHHGLFEQIQHDIRQLRLQRYSKAPEDLKPSKRTLIVEMKDFLKKEQELLKTRGYDNVNLESLYGFISSLNNRSDAAEKLKKGTKFEQAMFIIQSTLQFYYEFDVKITKVLEMTGEKWRVKVRMEDNLIKVAGKIERIMTTSQRPTKGAWKYFTDMIDATIVVDTFEELWGAY